MVGPDIFIPLAEETGPRHPDRRMGSYADFEAFGQGRMNPIGDLRRGRGASAVYSDDREFIAAHTGDESAFGSRPEPPSDLAQ